MTSQTPAMPITGIVEADLFLHDPLALLIGMMLDQQIPMEWAFKGPYVLRERLNNQFTAQHIASLGPEKVTALFSMKPSLHRFPGSMGKRAHALCQFIVDTYDGDTEKIWTEANDAQNLYDRLRELPGYGDEKTKIFIAILAKRFEVKPSGWEEVSAPFSDPTPRSVADVSSAEALAEVRIFKKKMKAAGKGKAD